MTMFEMTEPQLFEAFIKGAQYIVGLKSQQDIRDELGKFVTTYFPAKWTAFAQREPGNIFLIHHSTLSNGTGAGVDLTDDIRSGIADVLDSGFLASKVILAPSPSMTVFLPITEESHPKEVMLIGHGTGDPLPNELLNIYLAIAGLGSTTFELSRHRAHLEELVEERTSELKMANEQLEQEIAERKEAERALHAESERLSVTLGSIGDGVIATDTKANITLLNGVAEELTGWTLEEAAGRPLLEVFHIVNEKTGQMAEDPVAKALASGLIVGLANHTALIAKDGTERSISDSCAPIRAEDGSVIGAVLVFRDVTGERQAEELNEALNRIHVAIGSTLDFDEIMLRVVVESAKAVGVETAAIEIREGGGPPKRYAFGLPKEFNETPLTGKDGMITNLLKNNGWPIASYKKGGHFELGFLERSDISSFLAVPIKVKEEAAGAIAFFRSQPVEFTGAQVDFAKKLGSSVSLALENARLYEAERRIADTLQEALLTVPENLRGIGYGYMYRSATEGTRVGGDFYDLFEMDDRTIGITLGDVSGKGLKAAALTSVVRNTIRAYALEGYSPSEIMDKTNGVVMLASDQFSFITVFFAVLNTISGELTYCSAGHPPAILQRLSEVEALKEGSPIIGAFADMSYKEEKTYLSKGDSLVLYTDGITEARCDDGGFYGEKRLKDFLSKTRQAPAKDIPREIYNDVVAYSGGKLWDDIAVLVVSLAD